MNLLFSVLLKILTTNGITHQLILHHTFANVGWVRYFVLCVDLGVKMSRGNRRWQ